MSIEIQDHKRWKLHEDTQHVTPIYYNKQMTINK